MIELARKWLGKDEWVKLGGRLGEWVEYIEEEKKEENNGLRFNEEIGESPVKD